MNKRIFCGKLDTYLVINANVPTIILLTPIFLYFLKFVLNDLEVEQDF